MQQLIKLLIVSLLFTTPAWATTWYVRDGGGTYGTTSTTCNGQTNAVYTTNGGPNCAVKNPMMIMGSGCGNYGGGTCDVATKIGASDTVDINGDSDTSPGNQAQYCIGAGCLSTTSGNCPNGYGINCTMANIPSGTIGNVTTVQTTPGSTHQAQLWGNNGVNQVVEMDNSYVLMNNLELTDHSTCGVGAPIDACNTSTGGPWGGKMSLVFYGGTGSEIENSWIHGGAHSGTDSDNITGFTSYNNIISGNAFNGEGPGGIYSGSALTVAGVNTWQNDIIVYSGCIENYPLHSTSPYDTANYAKCYEDNNSGQGDSFGFQSNTTSLTGTVYIINSDISFGQQDGLDFLHCGSGTVYIYRTRFEGNMGQQVKLNVTSAYIENSLIIGDCFYFADSGIEYTGGNYPDYCRAAGDQMNFVMNGGTYTIDNTTLLAVAPAIIDIGASSACAGTLNWYNNNIIGGYDRLFSSGQAKWFDPECTSGSYTLNEDYNHVWNTGAQSQCAGAHDKCSDTSAGTTTTLTTSMLGPTAYYGGNDLGHKLYSASSGQLVGNANNAITLQGTSADFNGYSRGSSWDIGGYQHSSTVSNGGTCFSNGECSSGTCSNNICSGSCTSNGGSCSSGSTCCSTFCSASQCVAYICGDGVVTSPEVCDGANLNGQSCTSQGFTGGSLSCAGNCLSFVTTSCTSGGSSGVRDAITGSCIISGSVKY